MSATSDSPKKFAQVQYRPDDKLMQARCRLFIMKPWFGVVAAMFKWRAVKDSTMGVRIMSGGYVDAQYCPEWVEKLSIRECMGVVQHEIEHIIRGHPYRVGFRNHRIWNIATDMVINGKLSNTKIANLPVPGTFLPETWNTGMSSEEVYNRLQKTKIIIHMDDGTEKVLGDENAEEVITLQGEGMDDHSIWGGSTASADEARQYVRELCNQASSQVGSQPGHLIDAIKNLEDPHVSWRYMLRNIIGRCVGGKRRTWSRINRRRQVFGSKGKSNRARVPLIVGIDVSGSMDQKRLGLAFGALESASAKLKTTVVQFDCAYQCHSRYHRGDWKKIEIKGRGGTSFDCFFDAIEEKNLVGALTVIITDGDAPWPDPKPYPVLWIIIPHRSKDQVVPPFGKVIYIEQGSK